MLLDKTSSGKNLKEFHFVSGEDEQSECVQTTTSVNTKSCKNLCTDALNVAYLKNDYKTKVQEQKTEKKESN